MEIIILALLGFGAYKLYQFANTRTGLEAVRAYMFLEALNKGVTPTEANKAIRRAALDLNSVLMQNAIAMSAIEYREVHGGKILPVIGQAYRKGLQSTMPFWYRAGVLAVPRTLSVDVAYGTQRDDAIRLTYGIEYERYHRTYLNEVARLSGKSSGEVTMAHLLDDEVCRRAYRDGMDALVLATAFCEMHSINTEAYTEYSAYYDVFVREAKRLSERSKHNDLDLTSIDPNRVRHSFLNGLHPRLAADGFIRSLQNA
ncbi:hypothetical protein [Brucella pseudogrignonensis]|uniref:Uncharacterized protein n=1 Tax=Brucella pseudogrignonensis TaxID=419475 RepID=A0ABU1M3E1_9HYPH|nr:hypothetical protein [Brucella pseudogrignonensis]MDR6430534.1 hypothetical protein [Brucella pseudogrignonensis]